MKTPLAALASVICVILLGQMPCTAQNGDKVSLRFLSFPKAMEPVKVRLRISETEVMDIEAPSHWFSPAVQVSNPGVWSVGASVEGPDGKQVYQEYGRTKSLGSPQQMLLLVRKGEN
ncbi:MAG TPA: hypothetical protein VLO11_13830, partial [Luteolibacter sp.]|nr:hypothetical protein [Luteolibacter sp.]